MTYRPYPNPEEPCYDCGSTIESQHTSLCEMAEVWEGRDLPQVPGTQWWTEAVYEDGTRVSPELRPTHL